MNAISLFPSSFECTCFEVLAVKYNDLFVTSGGEESIFTGQGVDILLDYDLR